MAHRGDFGYVIKYNRNLQKETFVKFIHEKKTVKIRILTDRSEARRKLQKVCKTNIDNI